MITDWASPGFGSVRTGDRGTVQVSGWATEGGRAWNSVGVLWDSVFRISLTPFLVSEQTLLRLLDGSVGEPATGFPALVFRSLWE